jgi:SpoVK/Ycf46/Vps4 family AAA+-type ATPase
MAEGITATKSARICLFGPPGTGKTAFGRWLAERMEVPLHAKKGSDLLGMYVGETEKRISRAFQEAEEEGAVLLLDEVDSFLQDRRNAQRSWEVTAVNEMLTQMESFSGVFIASTNLMDGLDPASLRRFDLKVRFDYLKAEQAWALFQKQLEALSLDRGCTDVRKRLDGLTTLTPGDFAAVARRHRFKSLADASEMVEALAAECSAKKCDARKSIGFNC